MSSAAMIGNGILFQDGEVWKHSRNLIKPTFARSEISDAAMFDRHLQRFLAGIPGDGTTVDLQVPLQKLFLDAASEYILGSSFDSQLPDDPNDSAGFFKAFGEAGAEWVKRRAAGRIAPFLFYFDKKWKRACDKFHAYIDLYVQRALESTSPEKLKMEADQKTGTRYIVLHEMAKEIRDPVELRNQVLNVFVAGRNTISTLMANTIFHLARQPRFWAELREQSLALGDQPLTYELLKSLAFFRHVLHETLRLTGPSGRINRRAVRNTILPVGGGDDGKVPIFVEKGTRVAMDLYALHHDKQIWGDDAFEYNPHRWKGRKPMWEFLPFLGGPRICPAQQQVLTQGVYMLVRLTREFARIENRDEILEWVENSATLPENKSGIKVALFS